MIGKMGKKKEIILIYSVLVVIRLKKVFPSPLKKSAGVTPEVNLQEGVHLHQARIRLPT